MLYSIELTSFLKLVVYHETGPWTGLHVIKGKRWAAIKLTIIKSNYRQYVKWEQEIYYTLYKSVGVIYRTLSITSWLLSQ